MDYVLRFWNEEKVNLFKLLGNKLMHSESVSFEAPKSKTSGRYAWNGLESCLC